MSTKEENGHLPSRKKKNPPTKRRIEQSDQSDQEESSGGSGSANSDDDEDSKKKKKSTTRRVHKKTKQTKSPVDHEYDQDNDQEEEEENHENDKAKKHNQPKKDKDGVRTEKKSQKTQPKDQDQNKMMISISMKKGTWIDRYKTQVIKEQRGRGGCSFYHEEQSGAKYVFGSDESGRGPPLGHLVVCTFMFMDREAILRHPIDRLVMKQIMDSKKIKTHEERLSLYQALCHWKEEGKVCFAYEIQSNQVVDEKNPLHASLHSMYTTYQSCYQSVVERIRLCNQQPGLLTSSSSSSSSLSSSSTSSSSSLSAVAGVDDTKVLNEPHHLFLDGDKIPEMLHRQGNVHGIVNGDKQSYTIAAASIVAKVIHDEEIQRLVKQYPKLDECYHISNNKGYGTLEHLAGLRLYGPTIWHRMSYQPCEDAKIQLKLLHPISEKDLSELKVVSNQVFKQTMKQIQEEREAAKEAKKQNANARKKEKERKGKGGKGGNKLKLLKQKRISSSKTTRVKKTGHKKQEVPQDNDNRDDDDNEDDEDDDNDDEINHHSTNDEIDDNEVDQDDVDEEE